MHYVYVLKNERGEIYIGETSNLDARLKAHNDGRNRSTKGHRWEVVYYEAYRSPEDARKRERKLKAHGQAKRWLKERIARSLEGGAQSWVLAKLWTEAPVNGGRNYNGPKVAKFLVG
jgi:putative endonuclease